MVSISAFANAYKSGGHCTVHYLLQSGTEGEMNYSKTVIIVTIIIESTHSITELSVTISVYFGLSIIAQLGHVSRNMTLGLTKHKNISFSVSFIDIIG